MIILNIQNFLEQNLKDNNINRKTFALESGIPYSTITHIIKGFNNNPSIITIIKIADFFKCSIDEVLGRESIYYEVHNYNLIVNQEIINLNIKNFLLVKLQEQNINIHKLSIELGFSYNSLYNFVHRKISRKVMNSDMILKLSNYFNVSVDRMIGRVAA